MRITKEAQAGTLESSDALVRVAPADDLQVDITSTVQAQYGDDVARVVAETLESLGVEAGLVSVQDKGALEFVLRARVQGAVLRGADAKPEWSAR